MHYAIRVIQQSLIEISQRHSDSLTPEVAALIDQIQWAVEEFQTHAHLNENE
jgi:hypothetical protein